jgi:nitroimidazol reductase NimA-like FMN-containing flavoprotein (pyridoxamine 5'-phosphate oxidase superfamily)
MRRKEKQLSNELSIEILKNAEYGMLSTISSNGYPYITPLNFVFYNKSIYFHSAVTGHKLDNIEKCDKVSFCVTRNIEILSEKLTTSYESVIIFGKAHIVEETERDEALLMLVHKHSKNFLEKGKEHIKKRGVATKIVKIEIDHITGKAQ